MTGCLSQSHARPDTGAMQTKPIRRSHARTQSALQREYATNEPFVLLGGIKHWPACTRWTFDYLKQCCGGDLIAIEAYDPLAPGTFLDQTLAFRHRVVRLSDYLEVLTTVESAYALREDKTLFDDHPELVGDLANCAPFCSDITRVAYRALWIGPKGYVTGLHTDPGSTLLCQVWGRKRVLLYSPAQSHALSPEPHEQVTRKFRAIAWEGIFTAHEESELRDNVQWSAVNLFGESGDDVPPNVIAVEAIVEPGDALYIPTRWWHAVQSLSVTISVSLEPPSRVTDKALE